MNDSFLDLTWQQYLEVLQLVLARLQKYNFKLQPALRRVAVIQLEFEDDRHEMYISWIRLQKLNPCSSESNEELQELLRQT